MNKEKKNSRVILDLEKTDAVALKMLFTGFARAKVEDSLSLLSEDSTAIL